MLAAWQLSAVALGGVFFLCPVFVLVGSDLGCLDAVG